VNNKMNDEYSSDINFRLLIEARKGKVAVYPIAETDEETRVLLAAVLDQLPM